MKALFTPRSAREIGMLIAVFMITSPLIYPQVLLPQIASASDQQTGENQPQIFEIKDSSQIQKPINSLSYETLIQSDPLVTNLKKYLEDHDSPLAEYADKIPQNPQWQRALAISWVESNFGIHCANNNCSGIGVAPGHPAWRKYPTKLDWFKDMTALLEKDIYKKKYNTFEKMRGVYVYPGSTAWVNGAKTKYAELMALTKEAEETRAAMANSHLFTISTTETPQIAQLTR